MGLQKEIDKARAEIKTDGYSMSIGEWLNLYRDEEIDIHPEFQRFFRWSPLQKTRFIESILLGIPIPPIFVAQTKKGVWDVVDGLQRLSTIFQFAGILRDENNDLVPPLTLEATKYLPSLEGKRWNDPYSTDSSFDQAQRLYIKRAKLDVSIILRESEEKVKYELFQRINTGGSQLSDQEVRNCVLVMLDREFYFWLKTLVSDPNFQECIALTDKALLEQYDMDLALRFILFRNIKINKLTQLRDVNEFLSDTMIELVTSNDFNRDAEDKAFRSTFEKILEALGTNSFRRYDAGKMKFLGGFLLSAFETIALGIGFHDGVSDLSSTALKQKTIEVWSNKTFIQFSGSGVRASSRIPKLIPLGREIFRS